MHNILSVARLELKRKKTTLRPKAVISIAAVLILFVVSFVLLSNYGIRQQNAFYEITPTDTELDTYFIDSKFQMSPDAENRVSYHGGAYSYRPDRSLIGYASQTALLRLIRDTNLDALEHYEVQPKHLLYLNITERFREEILDRPPLPERGDPEQSSEDVFTDQPGQTDEVTEPDIDGPRDVPTPQPQSVGSIEEYQQEDIQDNPTEVVGQEAAINAVNTTGLVPSTDVETLDHVRDLFLIIQLLVVLNFVSALFGNAIFEEKLNQRSSLLFLSNLRVHEFVIGKILPYAGIALLLMMGIIGFQYPHMLRNPVVYLISSILILLYFSISGMNGFLARSNKEYSFLNVFTIAGASLYLLIPAFVANYSTLGYASLFTPLLFYAQQQTVRASLLLFLLPIYLLIGIIILFLASRVWNYEELYRLDSPARKLIQMVGHAVQRRWHYVVAGIFVVPFAWAVQLILIAVFLVVRFPGATPLFLLVAAFSEEIFKNIAVYATMGREGFFRIRTMISVSLLTGIGFLVAEKLFLILAILPYLEGYELFVTTGLVVPFLLHAGLTFLYLVGCRFSYWLRRHYLLAMFLNGLIHAVINFAILTVFEVRVI